MELLIGTLATFFILIIYLLVQVSMLKRQLMRWGNLVEGMRTEIYNLKQGVRK